MTGHAFVLKAQNYYLNNDVVDVEMGVVLNVVVDYVVSRCSLRTRKMFLS